MSDPLPILVEKYLSDFGVTDVLTCPSWPESGNLVLVFTVHLLRREKSTLSELEVTALTAMCRKVHVTKNIKQEYDVDWITAMTGDTLPTGLFILLAAGLLHTVDNIPTDRVDDRGMRLKMINSAFAALDRCGELDETGAEIHRRALKLLERELVGQ